MERRPALALAAAGALISAAAVATAAAGLLHSPEPSASAGSPASTAEVAAGPTTTAGPLDPVVVVEQRDVYDTFMVQTGTPMAAATSDPDAGVQAASPTPPVTSKSGSTTTTTNPSISSPTTTTVPSSTTTTRPPGVPSDWPADKPIPPMPPGCQKPQLEDNGVWNCDH